MQPILDLVISTYYGTYIWMPSQQPSSRPAVSGISGRRRIATLIVAPQRKRAPPRPLADANFMLNRETVSASDWSASEKTDPQFHSDI